jgi:subtilase family serine protease
MRSTFLIPLFLCILFLTAGIVHAAQPAKQLNSGKIQKSGIVKPVKKPPIQKTAIKPDLIVTDVGLSSDCKIKFTLKNYSKGKLTDVLHRQGLVKIRVTDKPSRSYNIPFRTIDPTGLIKRAGGKVTYTSTVKLSKKSYVKVDVDPGNKIPESNKTNNSSGRVQLRLRCIAQTVKPLVRAALKSDLIIGSFTKSLDHPTTIDEVAYTAVVRNQGPAASGPCKIEIKLGGEAMPPKFDVPALASGETHTIRRHHTLPVALTYLGVATIDKDNQVFESVESNNVTELVFRIHPQPRPDLIVESFKKSLENPTTIDEVAYTAVVRNQGPVASDPCKIEIKLGGEAMPPKFDVPALVSGETFIVRRHHTLPVALTYLGVATIDKDSQVIEGREDNNISELIFRIHPQPRSDLTIYSFTKSLENPTTIDEVAYTVVVKNEGPATSEPCKLEIKLGGEAMPPKFDVPVLVSGATHTIRRHQTLPVALTYLGVATVDKDHQVIEGREDNNITELVFRVLPPPRPDLTILSFKKIPSKSKTINTSSFMVVVKNIGDADSLACKLSLKIGGESKFALYSVPVIAPGGTHTVTRSVKLARAIRYRGVTKVDSNNANIELNEMNNEKILNFRIRK